MSLKKNILANYISQIYVAVIGIVLVPLYIRYMGAEAYGLVGFFAMVQAWFQLLDIGLRPTLTREAARFKGGVTDAQSFRRLVRVLEGIFTVVALIGALGMISMAGTIASRWLKVQQLPLNQVKMAITLMAIIVALRWICGLYRGAISGFERLVWLSNFNIIIATMRFVLVIPIFLYVGTTPIHFFGFELLVSIVEFTGLAFETYRLLPRIEGGHGKPWDWQPLRAVLKFSLGVAFTGSIWVLVTQTDKLVLSRLLPLPEYGVFILAVLAASGVTMLTGPISMALMPRMTRLQAEGNEAGLVAVYRNATQVMVLIAAPATMVLACFGYRVLLLWTGNPALAIKAAPVMALYAIGNGILTVTAFPYYLQFAKGELRLHILGNALFVVVLIPSLIWLTIHFGMLGAGWAWLASNLLYLMIWVPRVHNRFLPRGVHFRWLLTDILPIVGAVASAAVLAKRIVGWSTPRWGIGLELIILGCVLLVIGCGASSWARDFISKRVNFIK